MDEKYQVPNVHVSDLEKLTQKIRKVVGEEDTEVTFEFIIASLFPTSWKNIQDQINYHYTRGYIQGRLDKEKELNINTEDADCFCD